MQGNVAAVLDLISARGGRGLVAITGAGCSTESGIPDYRSPNGLYNSVPNFQPLTIQRFLKNEHEQKRYWGRSLFGFRTMTNKICNPTHNGLHQLCQGGRLNAILTQNVDGLHHLARHGGTLPSDPSLLCSSVDGGYNGRLIEMHGNIHQVACMGCGDISLRSDLQKKLHIVNTDLLDAVTQEKERIRPDADYNLEEGMVDSVTLVRCEKCGGGLRPHVVLFGENVPAPRVADCFEAVRSCSVLLCMGTSLKVYSAYRFVKFAKENGTPVVIINNGPTRGDGDADIKVETESVAQFVTMLESHI